MAALTITLRATIPAPIERVFELLTDPAQIPDWLPGCQSVEPPAPLRKGSRLRVGFGTRAAVFEVVELTPPHNFGWIERKGRPGNHLYFNLGFSGGSTNLAMKAIWEAHGLWSRLFGELSRRKDAKRFFEGVVNNLRRIVTS
ncbi:MAG TPA: SRPBCC family protein [Gemmatimonadales bacterium]|jgi:uncharacterized protein YndB with AHSA1/START domain|nr:SRPBCC family protein [Gemmatimonadales bacterium]